MWTLCILALLVINYECHASRTCKPSDFHYEFTECDEIGGRWRVSVPTYGDCINGEPNPPTRTEGCSVSCDPGWFFDLSELECSRCPNGTYSLGGGVHFDSWKTLPKGFSAHTEAFKSAFSLGRRRGDVDCNEFGWQASGDVLASKGGPCAAVLVYTVKLVKPGAVRYTYQYPDENIIFEFQAQDERCQSLDDADDYKWPPLSRDGQWKTLTVKLNKGLNVLHWKTIGIEARASTQPVLIKSIQISGVAHSSECTPCPEGTFSGPGANSCTECDEGTYAERGSSECLPCDPEKEYAPRGSPKCLKRPPCTTKDYYEIDSACDENNQTRAIYKWIENRVCREQMEGSVSLPPSGKVKTCPPCNPGMHYTSGTGCVTCPRGTHSDGISPCRPCPPSTAPNYGYRYQWWSSMPPNMAATCMPADHFGCSGSDGWQVNGDHIHSGRGHSDDAYLVLSLKVGGFRGREGFVNGHPMEVGRISFTFELVCVTDCEFVFMEASATKGVVVVQRWAGAQQRLYYSYGVTRNDSYTFSWAFLKVSWEKSYMRLGSSRLYETDMAKIFSINVTNTIDGGASTCIPCPQAPATTGCIPCPAGHYIEPNTTECTKCPPDTVVTDPLPYGKDSCLPCGPGLTAPDHLTCIVQCRLTIDNKTYDLTNISSPRTVIGSTLFTSSGNKFFHMFNISLCGNTSVTCSNNVSYNMEGDAPTVMSRVCRSTIVPGMEGSRHSHMRAVATQSVSLGDHLVGVTTNNSLMNISVIPEFTLSNTSGQKDLHFFYTTPLSTSACPKGRSTTVTLRCDPDATGQGEVSLLSQCPDGTCDGCNFHFLWKSQVACPECSKDDLLEAHGECKSGQQLVHYITSKTCRAPDGIPQGKTVPCTTRLPFMIEVTILSTVCMALFLCLLIFCLWKKNQRLEYKYMKLVASASSKDGLLELPPAESCALDDGEEEEVHFSQNPPKGILNRLKNNRIKPTEGRGLLAKSMMMTDKDQLT
ncbi:endosome/lysosome-associated apoptosis and autophagy regulator family member 2-like isoform X1 [Macrobrachium rosenbergii]|uniref:endosome/lysosome-associated apoptosis and autophagy regulator family member 2-like isoform X1 n=1 Tax=Macrobrachium rosenbergii TaxID=79674 RepID=UPI0034D70740